MDESRQDLVDRNRQLEQQIALLDAELKRSLAENQQLKAKIAELVSGLSAAQRASKRQAAPFSKNEPKVHRRKNGRKSGRDHGRHSHRPTPEDAEIDEHHQAELPVHCPHCGHEAYEQLETVEQFQEELPRKALIRKFTIHVGTCRNCRKRVRGRHTLQTSDAVGACSSQLGPDAQAAVVYLNKHAGMSYGKIAHTFQALFGIQVSRGGCAQVVLRAGEKLEPALEEIREKIRDSDHITPDETGWRVGGRPVWLHAWVGDEGATCYTIDPHRKVDALERLIGLDWSGDMTHDGCSSYDRFQSAGHQQCVDHAMRRARGLVERYTAESSLQKAGLLLRIVSVFTQALAMRDQLKASDLGKVESIVRHFWQTAFTLKLELATAEARTVLPPDEEIRTFTQHLDRHGRDWFLFLNKPHVMATNHRAKQALKTPIVNRKVFGGNQTQAGARAQEATSSVLQTCKNQATSFVNYLSEALCGCVGSLFA